MQVTQLYEVTWEGPDLCYSCGRPRQECDAFVEPLARAIEAIPGVISAKLYTPTDQT